MHKIPANPSPFQHPVVDVLVVGLGPAGASAMLSAAKSGLRVIGVERRCEIGRPIQCGEYIPAPLRTYANAAGIIVQDVNLMKTHLDTTTIHHSHYRGAIIDRTLFDQHLVQQALTEGATLLKHSKLVALDLTTRTGFVADHRNHQTRISFGLLIACDGPRSKVAKLMGLRSLALLPTQQYVVDLLQPMHSTRIWLSPDYPGGYAWLFPRGEFANLGVGFIKHHADSLKQALVALQAQLVAQGVVGPTIVSRTGGPIPVSGIRAPLTEDAVMFAGDAAGLTHPISGAGIAPAVYSGEQAGLAAKVFIRGNEKTARAYYEEAIHDCYGRSMNLALAKRAQLTNAWRIKRTLNQRELRETWITFPDYYRDNAAPFVDALAT